MDKIFTNQVNFGIYGNKPLYPVRAITTIRDMMDSSFELFADRPLFVVKDSHKEPYREIKYSQVQRDVYALGTALIKLGLKDRKIAVVSETRYEWYITYLATVSGVGTIVPIDKELPEEEMRYCFETAGISAVVFSEKIRKKHAELFASLTDVMLLSMDDLECDETIHTLLKAGNMLLESGDTSFIDSTVKPDDVNILLFTSGTTGLAKGVMLSHKNIAANLMNMCTMINITPDDRFFSVLPIHHTYECTCGFLCPIYRGSSVAVCEGLKYIVKNMQEAHPSIFLAVPLIADSIYSQIKRTIKKNGMEKKVAFASALSNTLRKVGIDLRKKLFKQVHENFGGNIKHLIVGAAALDPETAKGLDTLGISTLQGYGLTECAPIAAVNRDVRNDPAAAGLPLPESEVKISNPDSDGIGEIIVKGDNVMVGYYNNPEATAEVIKDGWFYTGDIGYIKDGFVYITGRAKNVIITANGKNVFPEEVETYLCRNQYIAEAMVYGSKDEKGNETIVSAHIFPAYDEVKAKLGEDASPDEIRALISDVVKEINTQLPPYKAIMGFDIRETEFIKTTTRKIKRHSN